MKPIDFLKLGMNNRAYQRKSWLLSVYTIMTDSPDNRKLLDDTPYALYRDNERMWFIDPETKEEVEVEGDLAYPLFYKDQHITIDGEWYHDLVKPIVTTPGLLLLNRCIMWECFGTLVPYHNAPFTDGYVKSVIDDLMATKLPDGSVPPGKATIEQCLKLTTQANYLKGASDFFTKAASIEVLTVHPDVIKLRDRLFKEAKAEGKDLNDPIVAAGIIDQVVAKDTELMLTGPSKDFFIDKKFIDNARKKMFLIFGVERDWNTGAYKLIEKPLADGWDINEIHTYINTAISAAYDRGKATGFGGSRVKDIIRLTSRIMIDPEDCRSKVTEAVMMTKDLLKPWNGSYHLVDGKLEHFTGDKSYVGKVVHFRTPNGCATPEGNFCKYCCGDSLGGSPTQASSEAQDIPTGFMLLAMKSSHVSSMIKTRRMSLEELFED